MIVESLLVRAAQASMVVGSLAAVIPEGTPIDDSLFAWTIRGVLALGLAAVAYLLNDTLKTIKETKRVQHDHATKLALHDIMFEQWLDELSEGIPALESPGRRRSDQIIRAIVKETRDKGKAP